MFGEWVRNQANRIVFVMVDSSNNEVSGIGDGNLTIEISKSGGAFAAALGADTEIGDGWYTYLATAAEADTIGPVAVKVDGAGAVQQNLEYVVMQRNPNAIEFTYTVTNTQNGLPINGVKVWITTDSAGNNTIWAGNTDQSGVARDDNGDKPFLDPGTYYFFRNKSGFIFDNPDTESVS